MSDVATITAEALKQRMAAELQLLVINVLSADAYDDCHINDSTNVPVDQLEEVSQDWEKDQALVVYCAHLECHASRKAYEKLVSLGFTNVQAYEGGTKEWKEKGYPTQGPCKADYLA